MGSEKAVKFWSPWAEFCLNMGETTRKMNGKDVASPNVIRFIGGRYETTDSKEITALRECSVFGKKVFEEDPKDLATLERIQNAAAKVTRKGKKEADLVAAFDPTPLKKK